MTGASRVTDLSFQADSDLRTKQYHAVRISGPGRVDIASGSSTSQSQIAGVLRNKPNTGQAATVGVEGEVSMVAGGAITAGGLVAVNGSGRGVAANSGDWTIGQAVETVVNDGEMVRLMLRVPAVRQTY